MCKNVWFVVPTNRLLQEKEVEATTYNKFFSIAVHEDVGEKLPAFDYSPLNVVVFDEVYMGQICMYWIRSDGSLKKILILSLLGRAMLNNCREWKL